MQELIDLIRAATAMDATKEQKANGVQACRTIIAALDTEPGKPLVIPGAMPTTTSRISIDQVLDLMIARLTMIASTRDQQPGSAPTPSASPAASVASRGLRVPLADGVSKGARMVAPKAAPRAPSRSPTIPRRKP